MNLMKMNQCRIILLILKLKDVLQKGSNMLIMLIMDVFIQKDLSRCD
jgi:hypothetical protein